MNKAEKKTNKINNSKHVRRQREWMELGISAFSLFLALEVPVPRRPEFKQAKKKKDFK